MVSKMEIFLFLAMPFFFVWFFRGGTVNWLPGSTVMVNSWQMLRGGRSPSVVVVVLTSRRWLKNIHFVEQSTLSRKGNKLT